MSSKSKFNGRTSSFAANRTSSTSSYESIRARKWHALFIVGRLYVIGKFGRVSVSRLLNGVLSRDALRNVSMRSITIRARAGAGVHSAPNCTRYTGFTATWSEQLLRKSPRRGAGAGAGAAMHRERCYQRASTACRSKSHLLFIQFRAPQLRKSQGLNGFFRTNLSTRGIYSSLYNSRMSNLEAGRLL